MSVVLLEASGAQVLPHIGDDRALISSWFAQLACSADMRAKYPEWRELAQSLVIGVAK